MLRPALYCTITVRDRQGRVTRRLRFRSRSFLKQWTQLVHIQAIHSNLAGVKCTDGVERTGRFNAINFRMNAGVADLNRGIRVGTGNAAVTITDYALETAVAEGAGSGQMNHQACTVSAPSVSDPYCSFTVSRVVTNNSGATITLKESAIYTDLYSTEPGLEFVCVVRDVFSTPLDVDDGGSISVDYTIRVQAP